MSRRLQQQDLHEELVSGIREWATIAALAATAIAWAFLAYGWVGSGTMTYPDFNLPNPTPATQFYNSLRHYERPTR